MSMADRDGFIWYDGKLVPWRNATTHVLTHSLHYGLAVFEGVRAYNTDNGTAIFRLKEHTERWFNSAKIYMMKMPYDSKTLMQAHIDVVRANKLVEVEEICEISSRLVVNQAALKMKYEALQPILDVFTQAVA